MSRKIIGFVGFISAGKSTAANVFVEDRGFKSVAFAGALKDAVAAIFSWPVYLFCGGNIGILPCTMQAVSCGRTVLGRSGRESLLLPPLRFASFARQMLCACAISAWPRRHGKNVPVPEGNPPSPR